MPTAVAGLIGALIALLAVYLIWLIRRGAQANVVEEPDFDSTAAQRLYRIVDTIPLAAVVVGPHDEILRANEVASASGVVRGSRIAIPELLDIVRQMRRESSTYSGALERRRIPGIEHTPWSVRVISFDDETVLVVAEDESEQHRVDAVRRDFVANISHELKTPIGAIGILSEAVAVAKDEPEAVEHFAGRLQREANRLSDLVRQIIELSRVQSEVGITQMEPLDFHEVINDAVSRTNEAAAKRHVNLVKSINVPSSIIVHGDRWQLSDAVANLIHNAVIYSGEGARVAVTLTTRTDGEDEFVDIKVADNGIGISVEDQERIFERFYRVDYGRSRESGGTGLGLSIVRHIVLAHGGTISVWSRPHQGSTFTISLPVTAHEIERDEL